MPKVEILIKISYDLEGGYWDPERGEMVTDPEEMLEIDLKHINKVGLLEFINGGIDEEEIELVESKVLNTIVV